MKLTAVCGLLIVPTLAFLISCGGSSTTPPPSKLTKRAFVTNTFSGSINIIDATKDQFLGSGIGMAAGVGLEVVTPDKTQTLVFQSASNTIFFVDNATEAVVANVAVPDFSESMVVTPDSKTAIVAVRNAPVTLQPSGVVAFVDLTNYNFTNLISVPSARWVYLNHAGSKALVFCDGLNQAYILDTSAHTATPVTGGFDHPIWAVFSSDDSKAYVLSCGPECGGTTAKVTSFDMASSTAGASVNVSAGTIGYLDSSNLYVAGTAGAAGKLDVVNVSNMTVSKSGVSISDGFHNRVLFTNGKLWVGARTCTNQNCLSIFDPSAQSATLVPCATSGTTYCPNGDVTGMDAINGRNIAYLIEGGELVIYDTSAIAPLSSDKQINLTGQVVDVKYVDQ